MDNHENKNQLQKRIEELEYRIAILEKYIDYDGVLMGKHDESIMNSIKIWILDKMKQKGYDTQSFKDRISKKFFIE